MSALACLRVVIESQVLPLPEQVLGSLVGKLTGAYLETRWLWPRTFDPITHYAFLLTDPKAERMDIRELARLSEDLESKLFGRSHAGKVALLLFEGTGDAVDSFARLDATELALVRADPEKLPPGGRLAQLLSEDLVSESSPPDPETVSSPTPKEGEAEDPRVRLHGVYFRLRNVFIGDVISQFGATPRDRTSAVEGVDQLSGDALAFDVFCLEAARNLLSHERLRTKLYVPLSYDNIIRPSPRAELANRIEQLPTQCRAQLAAVVYGVPRDPPFGSMSQVHAVLRTAFESVDLRIEDPAFEIEKVPPDVVAGVSFALPSGDERKRMAMLRQFVARRPAYKQRRIWSSITNVRTAEELAACEALGVPFVTGPAVCEPQPRPLAGRLVVQAELPIRS